MNAARMLLVLLAYAGPDPPTVEYKCDVIDLNYVFSVRLQGDFPFQRQVIEVRLIQVIFWDWSPVRERYCCQGYTLYDKCTLEPKGGGARVWFKNGGHRAVVTSTSYRESWTTNDPERDDVLDYHGSNRKIRGCTWWVPRDSGIIFKNSCDSRSHDLGDLLLVERVVTVKPVRRPDQVDHLVPERVNLHLVS